MKLIYRIIKESILIILFASILSSIGGIGLQSIEDKLTTLLPFLILFPALNGAAGNFGMIISSKFTTLLYEKKVNKEWWKSKPLGNLIAQVFAVAFISATYISFLAIFAAKIQGFGSINNLTLKIIAISLVSVLILVTLILTISITAGTYVYKTKHDPDNFLIPLTTSIADLCSMLIFVGLIRAFF